MASTKNSTGARAAASVIHGYGNLAALEKTPPLVIASGKGVRVVDDQGKSYIEGAAGMWCASFGVASNSSLRRWATAVSSSWLRARSRARVCWSTRASWRTTTSKACSHL